MLILTPLLKRASPCGVRLMLILTPEGVRLMLILTPLLKRASPCAFPLRPAPPRPAPPRPALPAIGSRRTKPARGGYSMCWA